MMVAWNSKDIISLLSVHALAPHSTLMSRCYHTPNPKIISLPPPSNTLSSSSLFGIHQNRNNRHNIQRGSELFSTSGGGDDNNGKAVDAQIVANGGATSTTTTTTTSTSFLRAVDNFGMKLKPWALSAYQRSLTYSNNAKSLNGDQTTIVGGEEEKQQRMKRSSNNFKSILCRIQSNILWVLYILYRGYRGFFVILPAVFREVYAQLNESDLVVDVYGDEEMEEREYAVNKNAKVSSQNEQIQQPMKLRTRITISILSGILTLSYVVSGALRVLGEFINLRTCLICDEARLCGRDI